MGSQSAARESAKLDSAPSPGPWSRYRVNLPRHLIGISRDLQTRVMQSLEENYDHRTLRLSFGPFLSLIWDRGRPLSEIAGELSVSRQACSQLANLVESAGYLQRIPNPKDRRSKLVRLTLEGRSLVEQGARLILEIESDYARLVATEPYRRFASALSDLYRGLGLPTQESPSDTPRQIQSAGLLPLIVQRIQRSLMEATIARGHPGLKMSHGQVLNLIGPDGGHIHEIARIQRVSRQAISAISSDLEALGYLQRTADPSDRRSVVLTLTTRGAALIANSVEAVDELERDFRILIGADQLDNLRQVAHDLYRARHLEEEIFEASAAPHYPGRHAGNADPRPGRRQIEQLATRLRRRLGNGDAAQLAELLETPARRTTT